jgi:hypothetical protein
MGQNQRRVNSVSDFREYNDPWYTAHSTPITSGDSGTARSDVFDLSAIERSLPSQSKQRRSSSGIAPSDISGRGSASAASEEGHDYGRQHHDDGRRVHFADPPCPPLSSREGSPDASIYEDPSPPNMPPPPLPVRERVPTPFPSVRARSVRGRMVYHHFGNRSGSSGTMSSPATDTPSPPSTGAAGRGNKPRETGARRKTGRPSP